MRWKLILRLMLLLPWMYRHMNIENIHTSKNILQTLHFNVIWHHVYFENTRTSKRQITIFALSYDVSSCELATLITEPCYRWWWWQWKRQATPLKSWSASRGLSSATRLQPLQPQPQKYSCTMKLQKRASTSAWNATSRTSLSVLWGNTCKPSMEKPLCSSAPSVTPSLQMARLCLTIKNLKPTAKSYSKNTVLSSDLPCLNYLLQEI